MSDAAGGMLPPLVAMLIAETGQWMEAMLGAADVTAEASMSIVASLERIDAAMVETSGASVAAAETTTAASGGMGAKVSGFFGSAGESLASLGPKVALAGAVFTAASVVMAGNFNQQMLRIQTQAGATAGEVLDMGKAIMDLAPMVGDSPKKLAEALYPIESVGLRGAKALDALKYSAEGAKVGGSDLVATASVMASVLSSGIGGAAFTAADAMGMLNAIVGHGKMTMDDLNAAMGTGILDTARTFGLSMQTVGAGLDLMTSNGVPAASAATRMRQAIALMAAPSQQAAKYLTDLGLSADEANAAAGGMAQMLQNAGVHTTQLADDLRQPDGLYVALSHLKQRFEDTGLSADMQAATITRAFGGGRLGQAIQSMFTNLDGLKGKFDDIGTSAGQFPEAWAAQQQQFNQKWDESIAKIEVLSIRLGEWLIPKIEMVVDWFSKHKAVSELLAAVIGGVLVTSLIAFGVAMIAANWEIILIVGAIALVVGAVIYAYTHWQWFRTAIDAVWQAMQAVRDAFVAVYNFLKGVDWGGLLEPVIGWVQQIPGRVMGALNAMWGAVTGFVSRGATWLGSTATGFGRWMAAAVDWVWNAFLAIPEKLGYLWGFIIGWVAGQAVQLPIYFQNWTWAAVQWVWDAVTDIWLALYNFWTTIGDFLMTIPGKIIPILWNAQVQMWKWIEDAAKAAPGKLAQFLNAIIQFSWDVYHNIADFFHNAIDWLWNAGGDILRGLINGVKSRIGEIGSIVSEIYHGFMDGLASAFGFGSPSRAMMVAGNFIGQGLRLGLDQSMPTSLDPWMPAVNGVKVGVGAVGRGGGLGGNSFSAAVRGPGASTVVIVQPGAIQLAGLVLDPVHAGREINGALERFRQSGGTMGNWNN